MQWRKLTAVRNLAVFAVVVGLCLFAPSAVRNLAKDIFGEFRAPVDALPSHLNDLEKFWALTSNTKRDLIEAGRDLARLNSAYELKLLENDILRRQVERFEKILNLPSQEKFKTEVARVCRRDFNAWWQQIVIRKGKMHGMKEGYAVVYNGGVVGRIVDVGLYTSTVELVSSRKFRMAAHISGDDRPIVYQGAGALSLASPAGGVSDVPADLSASSSQPLALVTSALAGTFPEGVPIGEIVSLRPEPDGIFKSGTVKLGKGLASIMEVAVLVPIADTEVR